MRACSCAGLHVGVLPEGQCLHIGVCLMFVFLVSVIRSSSQYDSSFPTSPSGGGWVPTRLITRAGWGLGDVGVAFAGSECKDRKEGGGQSLWNLGSGQVQK